MVVVLACFIVGVKFVKELQLTLPSGNIWFSYIYFLLLSTGIGVCVF